MRTVAVAVTVGAVLAASACGGNGGTDNSASARAIDPEAQKRAESIVLKLADFPTGWRASAPEEQNSDQEKFRKCIGVDYSDLTKIGEADSQDFAKGDSTEASSQAVIFKTDQQAEEGMNEFSAGMSGSAAEDCFQDFMERAFKEGGVAKDVKLGEVDVGELSFTPPPGIDEAKAWQIVIPVEITSGAAEGLSPSIYLDYVSLREGDTVASVTTQDVLSEFDPELRDKLVQAVADRMSESPTP